ncbi:hypothetical protein [Caproiciproducens sp.]|uniref:hypothetical protein n=1 Tax=Caproiciproducens sp. TaxID=1954376 RepID=UPI00289EED7A|nr:hypothetical protein [Caproiciproducens sp.]
MDISTRGYMELSDRLRRSEENEKLLRTEVERLHSDFEETVTSYIKKVGAYQIEVVRLKKEIDLLKSQLAEQNVGKQKNVCADTKVDKREVYIESIHNGFKPALKKGLDTNKIIQQYQQGDSFYKIAKTLDCDQKTVKRRLQAAGIILREGKSS